MRIYNSYQKYRYTVILILFVLFTGPIFAQNKELKVQVINTSIRIIDGDGNPVPNAQIVIGEGVIHTFSDENGSSTLAGYPNDFVTISAPGFEKSVVLIQDILKDNTVKLVKAKLFMTSGDEISLPFNSKQKKRYITGSSNSLNSIQLEKYPSIDIRNALTGLVTGLQITEYDGSTGISAEETLGNYNITRKIGITARGQNLVFIIDDIPMDLTEMPLDPMEIESITVLKDIVEKTMYGPIVADGIVLIKTKRGAANERILTVNEESGISVIDRFPRWVTSADYARLNNIARENDGLKPLYDATDINAYQKGDPYDMYHPSIDYRRMMLKNTKSFTRANISARGGNDVIQYSSYVGYSGEGDIFKIGSTSDYNRLIANSNIDLRINKDLLIQFDINALVTLRRSPNYGYATEESSNNTDILEFNSALADIITTPPNAFPVYANNDPELKYPWFAVSPVYPINPIGNLLSNGHYTETGRKGTFKFGVNYDFSDLLFKGLKSETLLGYDVLNTLRLGIAEDYIAYIPIVASTSSGSDTILLNKVHEGIVSSDLNNLHDYYFQRMAFYEKLKFERSFGNHEIQSSIIFSLYKISRDELNEPQREMSGVWTLKYTNTDKYIIQGVLNYAGTYSFDKKERYILSPSLGVGWIVSDENFMSNVKFIDFLKLRAEGGLIGCEKFIAPYYYVDRWNRGTTTGFGPAPSNQWFGSSVESTVYRFYPNTIGFPGLNWEKSKEFTVGFDGLMFQRKLSLEVNYYNVLRDGIITKLSTIPYIIGISNATPNSNLNSIRNTGLEIGLQLTNSLGNFYYSIGGNATIQNSKWEKFNEPEYRFAYQYLTGKAVDSYWGLTCLGKFNSDDETIAVPQLFDAILKKGDLKYKDLNGDNFIDDNDKSVIGHTNPRLFYSLNANLKYRNIELTVVGTGAAFFDLPLTNKYFWNGWGDNNYSYFVRDNLINGKYPRLTYYKVNNNFISSDFWLTKGDYFKLQNVELALNLSGEKLQAIRSRGARLFLRGANLLTITKVKDIDPESIDSGVSVYPLYRTFTGGIKLTF